MKTVWYNCKTMPPTRRGRFLVRRIERNQEAFTRTNLRSDQVAHYDITAPEEIRWWGSDAHYLQKDPVHHEWCELPD